MSTEMDCDIARYVWETRYRDPQRDRNVTDSWLRIATAVAACEGAAGSVWAERFYDLLEGFDFLPGGRVQAGSGTGRDVTLFNCFVMGTVHDDLESIFEHLKEAAITMQHGGGVGYDFSTLRPAGSLAHTTGRIASGPVSFMQVWDAMCETVLSTGARRGAMMATLRCDHPDIETFTAAKREAGRLTHFNLSVQVTEQFMEAVDRDAEWPLVFPAARIGGPDGRQLMRRWSGEHEPVACRVLGTVSARGLWEQIMRSTYEHAEPGVLFVDRINETNNLYYREHITATNPCGEIPLPPYGACDLGSINLTRFVDAPFTAGARLDSQAVARATATAVRFLDNVIDVSEFPLAAQRDQAQLTRRIGLGVTGLASALLMLGLRYDSDDARQQAAGILRTICHEAYSTSADLAREKGAFPAFDRERYLDSPFVAALPEPLHEAIAQHGIRNSHLIAIAPAGTISLLAGNVSSGIEPVFAFVHTRRVLDRDGNYRDFELEDYACAAWRRLNGDAALPDYFVSALQIDPEQHLAMQATLQPFVDNAISKTINVPPDYPFERFAGLYRSAWQGGLKGCTTYRSSPVRGEVLSADLPVHCCSVEREAD